MSELNKNPNEETTGSVTPAESQETVVQAAENTVSEVLDHAEQIKEHTESMAEDIIEEVKDTAEAAEQPLQSIAEDIASFREQLESDLNTEAKETLPPLPELPVIEEEETAAPEEKIVLPEVPGEEAQEEPALVIPPVPVLAAEEEAVEEAAAEALEETAAVHEEAAPEVHEEAEKPAEPVHEEPVKAAAAPKPVKAEPRVQEPVVQQVIVKKSRPLLTALLAGVVGLASGFGGGYLAFRTFAPKTEEVPGFIDEAEQETVDTPVEEETQTAQTPVITVPSGEMSIRDIAAKAQPSVVEIVVEIEQTGYGFGFFGQQSYRSQAAGSGVIISDDGYIITNNHVIEDALSITVTLYDGTTYPAEMIGTDEKTDIGVIKIDAHNLTAAEIGDSSLIQTGDTAIVIGNPLGTLGGTVTNGIVSATNREVTIDNETYELIQTNAAINSGNSGGGLFDGQGRLIGVVNSKDSGYTSSGTIIEGLGFAIPINTAMDVAEQLIEYGYVADRATLGVYIQVLTQPYGEYSEGLYITDVIKGSGAEAAGLKSYDKILSADGTKISSYQDLSNFLKKKKAGDTITLQIERDGHERSVDVTLTGPINDTYEG